MTDDKDKDNLLRFISQPSRSFGSLGGNIFSNSGSISLSPDDTFLLNKTEESIKLRRDLAQAQKREVDLGGQLEKKAKESEEFRGLTEKLRAELEASEALSRQLKRNQELLSITGRVGELAKARLQRDEDFVEMFTPEGPVKAFVVSVDIRKSTALMLKAAPKDFYDFIRDVYDHLASIIKEHHGIVDKFTGDGVLAFFPEFLGGKEAGLRAVLASAECHQAFQRLYEESASYFVSVLTDVGLGIGIDYGDVHIVHSNAELTVIGTPVVYACRFGGVPAGTTVLNQGASTQLCDDGRLELTRTEVEVKGEGPTRGYRVEVRSRISVPEPEWTQDPNEPADD